MTFFPERSVALSIGGFGIHWYGIMYMIAFLLAYALLPRLVRFRNVALTEEDMSAVMTAAILGVLIGGRLGYVFFYAPAYFIAHPLEVFAVWHGGMASHGGFIGVSVALWLTLRRRHINVLPFLDLITVPVALGLMLGRVGNFINLELYGTATTVPWAIAIPGVEGLRHPTQLYAVAKDLCIAFVCFVHLRRPHVRVPGKTFSLFLMLYGTLRCIVEYFRDQPVEPFHVGVLIVTRGQALTIPIIVIGITLWAYLSRKESA